MTNNVTTMRWQEKKSEYIGLKDVRQLLFQECKHALGFHRLPSDCTLWGQECLRQVRVLHHITLSSRTLRSVGRNKVAIPWAWNR